MTDDLGREPISAIARASGCRHPTRLLTPIPERKCLRVHQVDGAVFVFLLTALFLGGTGTIAPGTLSLFLIGLPAVGLGTWTGLKLFGRLNETAFRRVVLVLLLASGVALLLHLR
jgi:uncharacterized membrane protein YfcA